MNTSNEETNLAYADDAHQVADMLEKSAQSFDDVSIEARGNGNLTEAKAHERTARILRSAIDKLRKIDWHV